MCFSLLGLFALGLGMVEGSLASEVVGVNHIFKIVIGFLLTGFHGHVVASAVALVDLARTHDFVLGVVEELGPVGQPTGDSRNGKQNCEELSWDT